MNWIGPIPAGAGMADDADGAVGQPIRLLDDEVDDEAHAEGEDRKEMRLEAERYDSGGESDRGGDEAGEQEGDPVGHAIVDGQDADRIGADRHEARMGQVELARIAEDEVQPDRRDRHDVGERHHVDVVVVRRQERKDERHDDERREKCLLQVRHQRAPLGKRPCGRKERMRTSSAKAMMSL